MVRRFIRRANARAERPVPLGTSRPLHRRTSSLEIYVLCCGSPIPAQKKQRRNLPGAAAHSMLRDLFSVFERVVVHFRHVA